MRLPDLPPPFGSPTPLGASKMSIEEIAGLAKPHIKGVHKNDLQVAIQVLSTIEGILDVKGELGQDVIKRTEDNLGITLSKSQRDKIMAAHPSSGLKATVSPDQKGSIRFSQNNFSHVRRFLTAIL